MLLDELKQNEPELHAGLIELAEAWDDRDRRGPAVDRIWPTLKKIAIDYAVAEPAAERGRLAVVPGHFAWDDVGDFASLAGLLPAGADDVRVLGERADVVVLDAARPLVAASSGRLVAVLGIPDAVVVDTRDAVLVTTREHAQGVKGVVDALRAAGREDLL